MRQRSGTFTLLFCVVVSIRAVALDSATAVHRYARATWGEQEGLPSALIWAITQDFDGYLWLGTAAGLVRFDGVRFVRVDEVPPAPIRALLSARDGSLWIGMDAGSRVARLHGGRYTHFTEGLPASVNMLIEDHNAVIWAGGRGGLSWFGDGRWQPLPLADLKADAVIGIYEDRDNALWVATPSGLYRRTAHAATFQPVASRFAVRSLTQDLNGTLWGVGMQQAIGTVLDSPANLALLAWHDINGWRVIRDRQGNLWIATLGSGVLRVTGAGTDRAPTVEQFNTDRGLSNGVVRALFEDREGNIWVGTQSGLTRLSDNIVETIANAEQIGEPIRSVTADRQGSVWVGTDNGIDNFSGAGRRHFGRRDGLPTLVTNSIHFDRRGVMWAATDQGGLSRFENGRFVPVLMPRQSPLRRLWAMTSDNQGALWLCELDLGLFRWQAGRLTSLEQVPEIGRRSATAAFTDHAGRVWIGFSDGTVVAHDRGRFRAYGAQDGLPGGRVAVIQEDSRHTLWVGTVNGLSRLNDDRFVRAGAVEQVPLTNVRAIVEDLDHHLWVGTTAGIMRLGDDTIGAALFDASDGLRGAPMSIGGSPNAAVSADGSLWFATSSGIALIDPGRLERNWLPPPVVIEQVVVDNQPFDRTPHRQLPASTSRIQIDYTALSFAAPAKLRFRYKLEGFDRDWIDGGARRQAFYTNLSAGEYRFRVIAGNQDAWNEVGATWPFSIRPTFYQTALFNAGAMMLIAAAIVSAWKLRGRQVQQRFVVVMAERARVAREIHDTLLQSLVGVAFQFDAVVMDLEDTDQSGKQRLARMRQQIEAAIHEARESIWDLRSPALKRSDLASALREVGRSLCGRELRFELSVAGRPFSRPFRIEQALLRIASGAISNAVRHAQATRLRLDLCYEPDAITLRVIDDGCGFSPDTTLHIVGHWGLATMRERAEQLGGRLTIQSRPGRGTTIEVVAPLTIAGVAG